MDSPAILRIRNLSKSFPGTKALENISVDFYPGEVHILLGENGAGKSTLIKIISGVYQRDSGEILYKDKSVNFNNARQGINAGINVIHQELSLVPDLTVAQNIFLGRELLYKRFNFTKDKEMVKKAKESLDILGIKINPNKKVSELNSAQKQMIEIARAVYWHSALIIMDEPTSSLPENDVEQLFAVIKRLKQKGLSIIYITHRLKEIKCIGDNITILRDGNLIKTLPLDNITEDQMVSLMVGRNIKRFFIREDKYIGETILQVKNLSNTKSFNNISFKLRKGEILGISGLVGAGKSEVLKGIFGKEKIVEGEIILYDRKVNFKNPTNAIEKDIGFISEDRRLEGLLLDKSVKENITLPKVHDYVNNLFINKNKEHRVAKEYTEKLNVKTPSIDFLTQYLSGGNQQKVIIARWLAAKCKILLLDEPTRGIDVNAKNEIYKLMNAFTQEGGSIIMVSSELPEILGMSDRIVVMREGNVTGILSNKEATEEKIMMLASTG